MRAEQRTVGLIAADGGVALALMLGGCASEPSAPPPDTASGSSDGGSGGEKAETPTSEGAATNSRGVATVSIDGRSFEFDLRTCSVYDSGEANVSGLGSEVGSDVPSHLDGDSATFEDGEFRIDIGADGPFQSTDDFLAIGSSLGGEFSLVEDGDGYVITGQPWSGSDTALGTGTMQFSCN